MSPNATASTIGSTAFNMVDIATDAVIGALGKSFSSIAGNIAARMAPSAASKFSIVGCGNALQTINNNLPQLFSGSSYLTVARLLVEGIKGLIHQGSGPTQEKINEILNQPWGKRDAPETYMSERYISDHLKQFENGVTKISANAPIGTAGAPGGTFVMPISVADELIAKSKGDIAKLEGYLGLDPGDLGTNPVRIDIPNPTGLRMPSGNELGVKDKWLPGGYTPAGVPEAIIDPVPIGGYSVTPVNK